MAKKRKSENAGMDDVERTLYTSFVAAANSISQLYTQAQHQQKLAFLAGQRHASDKIIQWLQRGYSNASEVPINDLLDFLQRHVEPGGGLMDSTCVDYVSPLLAGPLGGASCPNVRSSSQPSAASIPLSPHQQAQHHHQQQQQQTLQAQHANMQLLSCNRSVDGRGGGEGGGGGDDDSPNGFSRGVPGMATLLRQGATLLGNDGADANDCAGRVMNDNGGINQAGKMSVSDGGGISGSGRRSLTQYTAIPDEPFTRLVGRGRNSVEMASHERDHHENGQAEAMINNLFSRSAMIGTEELTNGGRPMMSAGHHSQQMSALHSHHPQSSQQQQSHHHHHHHQQQQEDQLRQGRVNGFGYGEESEGGGCGDDEDACMDMGAISLEEMYPHSRVF